jgi:hypothetical protein
MAEREVLIMVRRASCDRSSVAFVLLAAASLLTACSSAEESGVGDQNMTEKTPAKETDPKPGNGSNDREGGPTAATSLGAGAAFAPKEVVVIADDDGDGAPRARIVASTEVGLCDRLEESLNLGQSEKVLSIWTSGAAFAVGKTTLTAAESPTKTAGASFLDAKVMCVESETAPGPDRGNGSLEITAVGTTVKGSLDIVFKGAHVTGAFEAKPCAGKVHGVMICTADPTAQR